MKQKYFALFVFLVISLSTNAQTVGLIQHDAESLDDGYILFSPLSSTSTYLIDKCGKQLKTWSSNYTPGLSVYILPDGTLLRPANSNNPIFTAGGTGGIIQKINWNGDVIWSYSVSDATKCQHHDVKVLPNGNILIIAWDSKTQEEAIASGRIQELAPPTLWSEQVLEVQPIGDTGGNIVWEWHVWDHLVQDVDNTKSNYNSLIENPQLININHNPAFQDWIHLNSIDYNPQLDQILLSSYSFNEIWIIDHSTTTAQAASHVGGNSGKGGDLLYRLGNPATYNREQSGNILFHGQHNAQWIKQGLPFADQIIVHDNGVGRIGGNYSTVEIINPPVNGFNYITEYPNLPSASSWTFNAGNPNNYYASFISGSQQLPNGNVLVCNGPMGVFFEVTTSGNTVWKYVNPVSSMLIPQNAIPGNNAVFRASFYPADYIGFDGHTLNSGNIIEDFNPVSENCSLNLAIADNQNNDDDIYVYPNPADDLLNIHLTEELGMANITLNNNVGQTVYASKTDTDVISINAAQFAAGLYYLQVRTENKRFVKKIIIK